jgi:putative transposase
MVGTLKSQTFVKLMDWRAHQAQQQWQAMGKLTVIVLDNASVHRSKLAKSAMA